MILPFELFRPTLWLPVLLAIPFGVSAFAGFRFLKLVNLRRPKTATWPRFFAGQGAMLGAGMLGGMLAASISAMLAPANGITLSATLFEMTAHPEKAPYRQTVNTPEALPMTVLAFGDGSADVLVFDGTTSGPATGIRRLHLTKGAAVEWQGRPFSPRTAILVDRGDNASEPTAANVHVTVIVGHSPPK
jgi:hypothetical protein